MADKGKKKHLVSVHTHRVRDKHGKVDPKGGFVHEHHYEDEDGNHSGPHFGGVSTDMDDLHQHMDDNLGPGADQGEQPAPEADQTAGAAAPAAGAPPAQAQ